MNELTTIEQNGQRVLTTAQLAECYGTEPSSISNNFNRNFTRYILGKHYYVLEGQEKLNFLDHHQIDDGSKHANRLYLWTEKGAWLHAKSLNTDQAWEAYDKLVDEYYRIKDSGLPQLSQLSPQLQMVNQMLQAMANIEIQNKQLAERVDKQEQRLEVVKDTFLQRDENWRDGINKMLNKVGYYSVNYRDVKSESYAKLEERAGCNLNQRLRNLKERLKHEGATQTKINNVNRLDVIEQDKRLKAIYDTIVKEMSLARV